MDYVFLEETWGLEENKNENYSIVIFDYLGNSYYKR